MHNQSPNIRLNCCAFSSSAEMAGRFGHFADRNIFHSSVRFWGSGGHAYWMKQEDESYGAGKPPKGDFGPQYATDAEVDAALNALSEPDYAKLMMIAASFCRQRRLSRSACEPHELLNQAVLKTLECEEGKRWNKKISMVRHLDRAMENISGHLVRERMRLVAFPDGLRPTGDELKASQPVDARAEAAKVSALLQSVFGDDELAKEVFVFRAEGLRPEDIQQRLKIDHQKYESTNRRILRKISQFVTKREN